MSTGATPKIVITKDELTDARIDEALQLQHKYVPPAVEPAKPKFRLIYAAWFYLMIAGGVGAFLAWAILEPHFHDMITFTGKIEQINPEATPITAREAPIKGSIRVAGIDVYLIPQATRIVEHGTNNLMPLNQLAPGQVVTLFVERPKRSTIPIAFAIHMEPPDKPVDTDVNISDLDTQQTVVGFILFPLVAGMVGLLIGAVEGIVCRTYARAASSALIGLLAGFIGGVASLFVAGLVFTVLGKVGPESVSTVPSFLYFMFRRGLAWAIAGTAMGLGQGFALKSGKLKFNGFIGGMAGGLLGGLLFDPINLLFLGPDGISGAAISRAVGFTIIGAAVGLLIGFTDLLTRDAWLRVLSGPLQGKEFSFNRTPIRLGSSPKNEIYLFKDSKIDPIHAEINKLRDAYEIVDNNSSSGTFVNGRRVQRERLVDGVQIKIGNSEFAYSSRENKAG
ncbi:MAG TPA: FHA domain-containing protein [Candidatus Angelobacter sp.]